MIQVIRWGYDGPALTWKRGTTCLGSEFFPLHTLVAGSKSRMRRPYMRRINGLATAMTLYRVHRRRIRYAAVKKGCITPKAIIGERTKSAFASVCKSAWMWQGIIKLRSLNMLSTIYRTTCPQCWSWLGAVAGRVRSMCSRQSAVCP